MLTWQVGDVVEELRAATSVDALYYWRRGEFKEAYQAALECQVSPHVCSRLYAARMQTDADVCRRMLSA
jgi:hypothetical protein